MLTLLSSWGGMLVGLVKVLLHYVVETTALQYKRFVGENADLYRVCLQSYNYCQALGAHIMFILLPSFFSIPPAVTRGSADRGSVLTKSKSKSGYGGQARDQTGVASTHISDSWPKQYAVADSAIDYALELVSGHTKPSYSQLVTVSRINMKIPGMHPEDLEPGTFTRVKMVLESQGIRVVQAYVRSGCIQVILELSPMAAAGASHAAQGSIAGPSEAACPAGPSAKACDERDDSSADSMSFDSGSTLNFCSSSESLPLINLSSMSLRHNIHNMSRPILQARSAGALSGACNQHNLDKLPPSYFVNLLGMDAVNSAEVLVQTADSAVFVQNGRVTSSASTDDLPWLTSTSPVCLYRPPNSFNTKSTVLVSGQKLLEDDVSYCVRSQGRFLKSEVVSSTVLSCFGMRPDMNIVELHIEGAPQCGLLRVECQRQGMLSCWRPLLVVDDPRIADELSALDQQLQQADAIDSKDSINGFLTDLGLWLEAERSQCNGGATASTAPLPQQLITACRLLEFCLTNGWGATADRIMSFVQSLLPSGHQDPPSSDTTAYSDCMTLTPIDEPNDEGSLNIGDTLPATDSAAPRNFPQAFLVMHNLSLAVANDGLSLLHRAVKSGKWAAVEAVLSWIDSSSCSRADMWSCVGPNSLTPLHLAAVLQDDGGLAWSCLSNCDAAMQLWTQVTTCDGYTPDDFARECGRHNLALSPPIPRASDAGPAPMDMAPGNAHPAREIAGVPVSSTVLQGESIAGSENTTSMFLDFATISWADCFRFSFTYFSQSLERRYLLHKACESLNWDWPYLAFVIVGTLLSAARSVFDGQLADLTVLLGFTSGILFVYFLMWYNRPLYCHLREPLWVFLMLWRAAVFSLMVLGWCPPPRQYLSYVSSWEYLLVDGTITGYFNQVRLQASLSCCFGAVVDFTVLHQYRKMYWLWAGLHVATAVMLTCGVNLLRDVQARFAFLRAMQGHLSH